MRGFGDCGFYSDIAEKTSTPRYGGATSSLMAKLNRVCEDAANNLSGKKISSEDLLDQIGG